MYVCMRRTRYLRIYSYTYFVHVCKHVHESAPVRAIRTHACAHVHGPHLSCTQDEGRHMYTPYTPGPHSGPPPRDKRLPFDHELRVRAQNTILIRNAILMWYTIDGPDPIFVRNTIVAG
jgi:hypothetical protein